MKTRDHLTQEDINAFKPETKIGIIATVNPEGKPHISLITTLQGKDEKTLMWGQFSQGRSKDNLKENPKCAFMIMTMDRKFWTGKADWTKTITEGEDYEFFNSLPMWRYNSYFGIHTVHYMDLVEISEGAPLPLVGMITSSLATMFSRGGALSNEVPAINEWTGQCLDKIDSLKFISFIDDDGYPVLLPALQCRSCGTGRIAFTPGPLKNEMDKLTAGKDVAVFGLTLSMEDVLLRGTFMGYSRSRGVKLGTIDIDWVYNSMPPVPGQIYPKQNLEAVKNF